MNVPFMCQKLYYSAGTAGTAEPHQSCHIRAARSESNGKQTAGQSHRFCILKSWCLL